jgi:hypothetical protein
MKKYNIKSRGMFTKYTIPPFQARKNFEAVIERLKRFAIIMNNLRYEKIQNNKG